MNTAEAMQALLDGKKIRCLGWDDSEYIYLKDGVITCEKELISLFESEYEYELYQEPKQKVKLYPFAVLRNKHGAIVDYRESLEAVKAFWGNPEMYEIYPINPDGTIEVDA